jgi:hypothetical protein
MWCAVGPDGKVVRHYGKAILSAYKRDAIDAARDAAEFQDELTVNVYKRYARISWPETSRRGYSVRKVTCEQR